MSKKETQKNPETTNENPKVEEPIARIYTHTQKNKIKNRHRPEASFNFMEKLKAEG